ncbi:MAG: putative prokaryotic signal transducing protein [Actinomycetia bacterium]|nr:putative prokaryotic signal transducing protein [Actinomycetes bacterium]
MIPVTLLTSVGGSFTAKVIVARLASEGIECEVRGAMDSPYALTMGDMARVDIYVPDEQLEDARMVLLVDEVDSSVIAPTRPDPDDAPPGTRRVPWRVVAIVVLLVAVLTPVIRAFFE